MKIFAISDLHLSGDNTAKPMNIFKGWENYTEKIFDFWDKNIIENDLILICGDISWAMTLEEAKSDIMKIASKKGKKIILKGNHDYWWKSITNLRLILPENFYALQNDCIKIENVILCGSRGWLCYENSLKQEADLKIYFREVERLKLSLKKMTEIRTDNDKVIIMMHYPPFDNHMKATPFTDLIDEYNIDIVVYGHIHNKKYPLEFKLNKTIYYLTATDQLKHEPKLILNL